MNFDLSPEQLALQEKAREVGLQWRGQYEKWDAEDESPYKDIVVTLRDAGLLGLTIPKQYGGKGGTALDYAIVVEQLVRNSRSWILGEGPFSTTGPGPSMILLSNEERTRQKYLPPIVNGDIGCAIALTEPDHGSDLTDLETTAVVDGDHFIVNGHKRFITGSPHNELYAVFARFDDIPGARGVGCILVEAGTPGCELLRGVEWLGCRGMPHGEVILTDCRVPKENVVRGAGHFRELMTGFNMERLHNSIFSLSLAGIAYDEAVAYVEKRQCFGKDVIQYQSVYHDIVDMYLAIEAQRLLTWRAASTADQGVFPKVLDASLSKLFGSQMAPQVTLTGVKLHGGDGVTMDFPVQTAMRDAVSAMVAGGAPAVLKNAIAAQLFPHRRFPQ
ncbi:acyl-CoA dehydrogenase family protein [Sphingobium sp. EM0848]|uniref:acyl-CoA dehydrogenase family protein n=1 Tax=Sphingobium sp. EM0848 TaxID=2743473 RepID=UPI00159C4178|nr:acyl-CoA dehydrogenase family protein [Sphingobium sp. EM0848]